MRVARRVQTALVVRAALLVRMALLALLLAGHAARAAEPLSICVAAENPPLSYPHDGALRGLDVRIAEATAQALGRPLKLVPFESAYDHDSTLAQDVAALLASGQCAAVSGFPLLSGDLGVVPRERARAPDTPGAPRKRDRPFIPLQPLVAGRAYLGAALGLVLPADVPGIVTLADLARLDDGGARTLGTVGGSMASALALTWRNGVLRKRSVALAVREDAFAALAEGRVGAVLGPLARFDGWRLAHPGTPLHSTAWRRPLGINLGFVTLVSAPELRAALDAVVAQALADGTLARWAAQEGVSWTPPTAPDVGPGPTLADLTAD